MKQKSIKDFTVKFKKISGKFPVIVPLVLIVLIILLISYYILFPSRGYFHSDTTDTIMWAEATYESGKLLDSDFYYACLLPFGTSLIMTALMPFTGVTMTTHVIGMLIFFLLFAGGLLFMLRQMHWNTIWCAVALFVTCMTCSGSEKLREIFWGHTIYYSLGVWFIFVGLGLVFRYMHILQQMQNCPEDKKLHKRVILCLVVIGIWFVLTCTDQIAAITIFALPVIGAVFCERWLDKETAVKSRQNFYGLLLFLVMGIGMVAGYFLTEWFAGDLTAGYEDAYSSYSDASTWADHILTFLTAWLSLLGMDITADEPFMTLHSVQNLLLVITGILLLLLPAAALCCYHKIKNAELKILILTYWFMTMLIMMGYIMGKLSAANWRLSPIVALSAVVSVAFLRWVILHTDSRRLASLLMIPVFIVSAFHAVTILKMPADNTDRNALYALADELESKNLTYGYATFWQANALTIISDSQVKCRDVTITDGNVSPRSYQSHKSWYDNQENQETYFLLLTTSEREDMASNENSILDEAYGTFNFDTYVIYLFDKNIFDE